MKKRVIALALCMALLAMPPLVTRGTADNKLNFLSINDQLPPELINTVVTYGGQTYVPASLFSSYNLGITYVYFSGVATAYLYSGDQQLFFELNSGKTYDGDDFYFSVPAIFQGGTVYLPLSFICSFFGTPSYAYIGENEYGRVLRITTGAQVLSHQEFLRAAGNVMRTHYQTYYRSGLVQGGGQTPTSPEATPAPGPHEGDRVYLAMLGLPDEQTLSMLRRTKADACFFLTAAEAYSNQDTVRRLVCSGYSLGINCPGGTREEYDAAAVLLLEIARVRTLLTYAPPEQPTLPGTVRLACDAELPIAGNAAKAAYAITAQLKNAQGDMTLALPCGAAYTDALSLILYYLSANGFTVAAPRVTNQLKK